MLTQAECPRSENVLTSRGWLASEDERIRTKILNLGREKHVSRGKILYAVGSQPGGLYAVLSGGISVEGGSAWHLPRVAHIFRSGDWFGFGPVIEGGMRTLTCTAFENSRIFFVPLFPLKQLVSEDPSLLKSVSRGANYASTLAAWIASDLLIPDASRRVAAVLLRITGWHEGVVPDDPLGFPLTQTEIGSMANVSRIHTMRILITLSDKGWIQKSYGHLKLIDGDALSQFAYSAGED
jgi:CRP/FNR family transcriptional regulator, cyclic AMP receptor protein